MMGLHAAGLEIDETSLLRYSLRRLGSIFPTSFKRKCILKTFSRHHVP